MVSWYHHCLYRNEHGNAPLVDFATKHLSFKDRDDITNNLPKFIEFAFENKRHPRFSWTQFVEAWHGHTKSVQVKYEDFHSDGVATLISTVKQLAQVELDPIRAKKIVDTYSFSNIAGRKADEEKKIVFYVKESLVIGETRLITTVAKRSLIMLGSN